MWEMLTAIHARFFCGNHFVVSFSNHAHRQRAILCSGFRLWGKGGHALSVKASIFCLSMWSKRRSPQLLSFAVPSLQSFFFWFTAYIKADQCSTALSQSAFCIHLGQTAYLSKDLIVFVNLSILYLFWLYSTDLSNSFLLWPLFHLSSLPALHWDCDRRLAALAEKWISDALTVPKNGDVPSGHRNGWLNELKGELQSCN